MEHDIHCEHEGEPEYLNHVGLGNRIDKEQHRSRFEHLRLLALKAFARPEARFIS